MKTKKINTNNIKISKLVFIGSVFLFALIIFQVTRLSLSSTIDGVDLKKFASNRNTQKEILYANRGTIYNITGEPLAQTVDSYTVIAYLDSKRSEKSKKPLHVVDKQVTADSLAPLLNMESDALLTLLSRPNLYQVELGPGGKGITEITKENIEKLQLPGIDFIQTHKRYYPNNDFLSYTLGYVQAYDGNFVGEMGIEKYFDDYLKGKDGSLEYQKDLNGYRIPNTPEVKKDEVDGMDIYLTIDENIQLFIDTIIRNTCEKYDPDWMLMVAADAKTGRILGTSSSPSFDPNIKNITNYLNPLVSFAYEPGSTMKTFTYMAAIEKGTYDGDSLFTSGSKKVKNEMIYDWNRKGWGEITFNRGYALSSNVGASTIIERFINANDLKSYFKSLGFDKKTGFTLPGEVSGEINFKYAIEAANAAFGQGITVTPIQFVQALTAIANNGVMLKPYIVDKIIDPNNDKIVFQGEKEELGTVAKTTTIDQIKNLMFDVVNGDPSTTTGSGYKIAGYDIIGKTGTAQYVNPTTGQYYQGTEDYIRSFAGMFPKNDPKIIIYSVIKRPDFGGTASLVQATKKLINDIAKYLNLYPQVDNKTNVNITQFKMPNLINQTLQNAETTAGLYGNKLIILGDGNKVVNQYPSINQTVDTDDKIFIVTNSNNITMPNLINWSSREALTFCNLVGIDCQFEGYGYVYSQSVSPNSVIDTSVPLLLQLKTRTE